MAFKFDQTRLFTPLAESKNAQSHRQKHSQSLDSEIWFLRECSLLANLGKSLQSAGKIAAIELSTFTKIWFCSFSVNLLWKTFFDGNTQSYPRSCAECARRDAYRTRNAVVNAMIRANGSVALLLIERRRRARATMAALRAFSWAGFAEIFDTHERQW